MTHVLHSDSKRGVRQRLYHEMRRLFSDAESVNQNRGYPGMKTLQRVWCDEMDIPDILGKNKEKSILRFFMLEKVFGQRVGTDILARMDKFEEDLIEEDAALLILLEEICDTLLGPIQ